MKYIDELVKGFLSDDELRPALMQPHVAGDKVVATDAHTLIIAPIKYFKTPPTPNDLKFPNYQAVIPPYSNPLYEIALSDFKAKYNAIPKVGIFNDCEQCDGYGSKECPCCQQEAECKECKGTGNVGEPIGYEAAHGYLLKINDIFYNPNLFKKIADVVEFSGEDKISIYSASDVKKTKGTLVITKDIMLLLMPYRREDEEVTEVPVNKL